MSRETEEKLNAWLKTKLAFSPNKNQMKLDALMCLTATRLIVY